MAGARTLISRRMPGWAGPAAGAATLAAVVLRLGTGPFRDGLGAVDPAVLAAGMALGAVSTLCCAWRWAVVAERWGVPVRLGRAVAWYYRSVFLNLTLPGGVVGDVHRALDHGRRAGEVRRAACAVVWERAAGQAVQLALTLIALLLLPSPVPRWAPIAGAGLVAVIAGVTAARWRIRRRPGLVQAMPAIGIASGIVVVANSVMFVVAARTAGVTAPVSRLAPLALIAMAGMVLPSVAGWGPREGVTAWAFATAGLGAAHGVATAVVYGVMAVAGGLPGAVVLACGWSARGRGAWPRPALRPGSLPAPQPSGAVDG